MPRRIQRGGSRGDIYREVAKERLLDAHALIMQRRYNAAIYLAGYAIEFQLKFAICQQTRAIYLPEEFEIHSWDKLAEAAGLIEEIAAQKEIRKSYEGLVDVWGPWLRYETRKLSSRRAESLYNEIVDLYGFLKEFLP